MNHVTHDCNSRIAALVAAQPPGHCLSQALYNDEDVFQADVERIFMRHWLYAGHVSHARNHPQVFEPQLPAVAESPGGGLRETGDSSLPHKMARLFRATIRFISHSTVKL